MANEKKYAKIYTCPYCGSGEYMESDYEPIAGKEEGTMYQYYACVCADCKKRYYNVARYIGAMTAEEINELVDSNSINKFTNQPSKYDLERIERYYNN